MLTPTAKRRPITAEERTTILRNADRLAEKSPHFSKEAVEALLPPEYVAQIATRIGSTGTSGSRLDWRHAVEAVIAQCRNDVEQGLVTVPASE